MIRPFATRHVLPALVSTLCLGFFVASTPLLALDPERAVAQYALRKWRIEEGLPQNSVREIVQTPDGFLWIATHAGLARFDGLEFEVFSDGDRLDRVHVYALAVDRRGDLWVGTNGGGLLRRHEGRFVPVDGLPSTQISSLLFDEDADGDEVLWIGTEDGGLARLDAEGIETWAESRDFPETSVQDLVSDGEGGVWAAVTGRGVIRVSAAGELEVRDSSSGLPSENVWSVYRCRNGRLWAGTTEGLALWHDGRWRVFGTADGLPSDWVRALGEDRDGNLWVGTTLGLARGTGEGDSLRFETFGEHGDHAEVIWSIFEDREGHLWFGSLGGGLHQLVDGPAVPFGFGEGLAARQPLAVLQPPGEEGLWIATRGGGLQRFFDGRFEPLRFDGFAPSIPAAWSLAVGPDGDLWAATTRPSLAHVHDGRVRHYTREDGLGKGRILTVALDAAGEVWVATSAGLGRFEDDRFVLYTTEEGLVHDQCLGLSVGPDGRLWIGTNDGLSVWDGERFENFRREDGLRNGRIWSLLALENTTWAGSFGGGLHRLRDDRIDRVFTTEDGLPSNDITSIVEDGLGYLWLGTTRGLARVSLEALENADEDGPADLPVIVLDTRDGLRSAERYGGLPGALRTRDGYLWFTTLDSLARIDPGSIESRSAPRVIFSDVRVDGDSILSEARAVDVVPQLGPDLRQLEIRYTAATLRAPSRHRFRYRLRGFEEEWRGVGTDRDVSYTHLPPGGYVFEVEASDDLGRFEGRPARFAFHVLPRFTETGSFYSLLALGLVASGVGVQQIRVRRLRSRQDELRRVAEDAVANVRSLRGLLPICAGCKMIRDDAGYWNQLEVYLDEHSDIELSHGLCPDCMEHYLGDMGDDGPDRDDSARDDPSDPSPGQHGAIV